MYKRFDQAMALFEASLTDSAAVLLSSIRSRLQERSGLQSPFALLVRLQLARSLERDQHYREAAEEFLAVADDSQAAGLPELEAQAYLEMALIHEQQSHPVNCHNYLVRAERLVRDNQLRKVMAYLFIRLSSYHRLFGSHHSAERYGRLALNHALDQSQPAQMATAHLLLSLIYRANNPTASEYHLRHSSRIYQQLNSDINHMIVMVNLSALHLERGDFAQALVSNDSALYYSALARARGSNADDYQSLMLKQRSTILQGAGQLDSAIHYLDQSHIAEVSQIEKLSAERVAEVEARYNTAKKEQQIQQQAQQLQFKKKREQWLMWLMLLAVISLGVVAINYVRLRRANAALGRQSRVIHSQNDELASALREQQLLRGEIHHRVKNNLQIIISLLELQIEEMTDPAVRDSLKSMEGRVYSMAAIHEILYREGRVETINFRRYVEKITDHFSTLMSAESTYQFNLVIPDWEFNLETAIPLGTILNELLTNSFKYAAAHHRLLRIDIRLRREGSYYRLDYRDNGPGFPTGELVDREGGLGTYLVNGMSRQLRGRVETYNDDGACTQVYFNGKNNTATGSEVGLEVDNPTSPPEVEPVRT